MILLTEHLSQSNVWLFFYHFRGRPILFAFKSAGTRRSKYGTGGTRVSTLTGRDVDSMLT